MTHKTLGRPYDDTAPVSYERTFVPTIGEPLAADLVAAAALRPGERVLDVACGTGVVARLAARVVGERGSVAGLDVDPHMLGLARRVTPAELGVRRYETSAESTPLPDGAFHVVLCQMGLQLFAGKLEALQEMRRMLAPGGRALVSVPGAAPRLGDRMIEAGFQSAEAHVGAKVLAFPVEQELLWQTISSTPLSAMVPRAREAGRGALESDVCACWRELVRGGELTIELQLTTVIGRT